MAAATRFRLSAVLAGVVLVAACAEGDTGVASAPTAPLGTTAGATTAPPTTAPTAVDTTTQMAAPEEVLDLEYGTDSTGSPLLLDLWLPARTAPLPVLVFVHGGGWWEGSRSICPGDTFRTHGYAVACIDYRLALAEGCPSDYRFPTQVHDVKSAVRWLRGHASEYGLDAARFALIGDSSGGHLATLAGVSAGVQALQGDGNPGASDEVQAVVDWFGPVDIRLGPMIFDDDPCVTSLETLNQTHGGEETPFFYWTRAWGLFLGGSLIDPATLDAAARATPLSYLDPADPPILVIHGEGDGMVPIAQSEALVSALEDTGIAVTFVRAPDGHTYRGPDNDIDPVYLEATLTFLAEQLGK